MIFDTKHMSASIKPQQHQCILMCHIIPKKQLLTDDFIQQFQRNDPESQPNSPPRRINSRETNTSSSQMLNGASAEDDLTHIFIALPCWIMTDSPWWAALEQRFYYLTEAVRFKYP